MTAYTSTYVQQGQVLQSSMTFLKPTKRTPPSTSHINSGFNNLLGGCRVSGHSTVMGVFSIMHWAHRIKDTNTLSQIYTFIYLLPPSHRHGDTRRYSWVIETLTNGRKEKV